MLETRKLEIRKGDLFAQNDLDAIGHGVNCYGVMSAGIAVIFKRKWPSMFREYAGLCKAGILQPGRCFAWENGKEADFSYIYNLASQFFPGPDATVERLRDSLAEMVEHAEANGVRSIGLPLIGGGIGGISPEESEDAIRQANSLSDNVRLVLVTLE